MACGPVGGRGAKLGAGGGGLFSDQTWATGGIVTPQLDGFTRCHSSPFFFSLSLNLLSDLRKKTVLILWCLPKAHFLPSFWLVLIKGSGTADLHLLVCSHTPLVLPSGGGRTARRRRQGDEVDGAACTLLHELLLRLDR